MKRNTAAVVGALGIIALAVTGCSASSGAGGGEAAPVDGAKIKVAVSKDPGAINPILNATGAGTDIAAYGYDSLLSFAAGKPASGVLAESWEESPTEATFTLKEGILCQDGTELTASDVKATFEYANENGSPYIGVYFDPEVAIDADDAARTVKFTNPAPDSFLAQSVGALPIVCASGLEDPAKLDTEQFGTGAYKLVDVAPGQNYTFELRDDYTWGPDGVTSDTEGLPATVEVSVVESDATRANMMQSGELDIATVTGTERDRLQSEDFAQVLELPLRPGLVFFNQNEGRATNDLAVRTAIANALDRDEIGNVSSSGRGAQLVTLVPEIGAACTAMDSSAALPAFDTAASEKGLDAAGWKVGSDGIREKDGKKLSIKLLYPVNESASVTAAIELMQVKLKVVGIDGVPTPTPAYTDVIFSGGDWDLVWAPIFTSLPSNWAGILGGDFPPNGGNWTYNTNEEYFDLVAEASKLAGEDSCGAWEKAQDSLFSNLEILPFYSGTETAYGTNAEFAYSKESLSPISIRVVK
ncbi:peptide/nickel transport system substrate-binding protein [Leucobacter exalbidus]|uniref:Peptide/nickel transport system substrate-binding protein n=1 Tax=Leucobacter exalbidus TaxID=662960 RepID=A0A940T6F2_9MICO|nr:ABC transporter substrate-binding protein [Leucobacter exalbidus]MBP1326941.1 peptide/nickel transport system substrate-binding protein [Leucobacter exalbidus]